MELRTVNQRLDDLEHDNNMLRRMLADVQTENTRLAQSNEELGKRIVRLCNTVDDMVGRFSRVQ
jgi:predicted  nucleic acid-binding Zn-ribbon protein